MSIIYKLKLFKIMRKLIYMFVAITFAASIVTSCGKTTKGKMDGEWTISSGEETESNLTSNYSNTTKINGAVITQVTTNGSNPSTTTTGVVNEASWTIKKDGTWTRTIITTFTQGVVATKTTRTDSGNWDFLKSVSKDYKTNERVIFNVLTESTTTASTSGSQTSTSSNSDTYLDGENSFIYIVTESKKDELTFNIDGSNTATSTNLSGTTTTKYTSKSTYTLTK